MNNAIGNHAKIAKEKKDLKIQKYSAFHNSEILKNSTIFQPIVLVLPGYIEKDSDSAFDKICSYIAEQQDIPIGSMKTFLYRKIQFSLLKSLSRAIINNNCRLINIVTL